MPTKKFEDGIAHHNIGEGTSSFFCALPTEVDNLSICDMYDSPPSTMYAVAQINLFSVHEVVKVEAADLFKDLPFHHQTGS